MKVGGYLRLFCACLHAKNFDLSIRSNLNASSIQHLRHMVHTEYTHNTYPRSVSPMEIKENTSFAIRRLS